MKIELKQRHKSTTDLNTEDLPDFAVLIGRNGVGKTQILAALDQGVATIPGIGMDEIELHNLSSFHPPNTNQAGRSTNQFALNTADAYLLSQSGRPAPIETAAAIFNGAVSDIEHNSGAEERDDFVRRLKWEIQGTSDFAVFGADNQDSPYKKALHQQVFTPLSRGQGGRSKSSNQSRSRIAAYDEAKVTILTEGHNAKHLKRWVELNFPEDVHVFEGLESYSSDSQLLTYGRLLGRVTTNTHFVVVWDCDAAGKAEALRGELPSGAKVTPFAFARRENTIARNGIENNYDEVFLERFSIENVAYGGKSLGRMFPASNKTEFANHAQEQGTPQYFTHFQDLHDIVSGILGPPEKA